MQFHLFSLKYSSSFLSPEALLVIGSTKEIPKKYITKGVLKRLRDKEVPGKVISIDGQGAKQKKCHILLLSKKRSVADQVAEAARQLSENSDFFVGKGVDLMAAVEGFGLGVYRFEYFLSKKKNLQFTFIGDSQTTNQGFIDVMRRVNAVYLARDLVNLPPNKKTPQEISKMIHSLVWKNTQVTVLGVEEMEKEGFGMLLSVGKGSNNQPCTIILEHIGNKEKEGGSPIKKVNDGALALVGKGVVFDSGGIQIKSGDGMHDMKMDMAGAASVIAALWYLDPLKLQRTIIGAVGMVENMTGGSAMKPLDIVTSHSGLTVEIHHTDAEGRLVLGDVASYVTRKMKPECCITIATLTGACMHALGYDYAGLFSESPSLIKKVITSAKGTGEKVWELPLDDTMLKSTHATIADRKSMSNDMKAGGSLGAAFIAQFIPSSVQYAHLDIAGPAYRIKPNGIFPSEATGFGVLTLSNLAQL